MPVHGFLTPFFLLAAFILLLLVSLSLPIIKTIWLFRLSAQITEGVSVATVTATGNVRFGVWGYCISAISASALGVHITEAAECTKAHLGYTLDSTVASALHVSGIENDLSHAVTAVLVLHPIACGLAFLALLLSLAAVARPTNTGARVCSGLTLAISLLCAVLTTIVFLIDVIAIAVVKHKVHNSTHGAVTANWGNATWMVLGAAVAVWAACLGACCGLFEGSRTRRKNNRNVY